MSESDGGRGGFSFPPSGTAGGAGDTVGPASSTDNTLARFDGTTGKLLQGSLVVVDDAGGLTATGPVLVPFGTAAAPGLAFAPAPTRGLYGANGGLHLSIATVNVFGVNGNGAIVKAGMQVLFSAGDPETTGADAGVVRVAAGVLKDTDGSGGYGWRQWAGESYLAANATNATATLANTGLSVTVKSGRKYAFKCILYVSDSTAAEGAQIDFGGGSATAANFRAHVTGFDTALTINTQVTTLTTPAGAGTFTGAGMIEIHGSLRPSTDGTFAPRFAQNTHAIGTLTLFEGSHLLMWDMP